MRTNYATSTRSGRSEERSLAGTSFLDYIFRFLSEMQVLLLIEWYLSGSFSSEAPRGPLPPLRSSGRGVDELEFIWIFFVVFRRRGFVTLVCGVLFLKQWRSFHEQENCAWNKRSLFRNYSRFSLPTEYQIPTSADSQAFTCSTWHSTLIFVERERGRTRGGSVPCAIRDYRNIHL